MPEQQLSAAPAAPTHPRAHPPAHLPAHPPRPPHSPPPRSLCSYTHPSLARSGAAPSFASLDQLKRRVVDQVKLHFCDLCLTGRKVGGRARRRAGGAGGPGAARGALA
jgi:hypothetical protein